MARWNDGSRFDVNLRPLWFTVESQASSFHPIFYLSGVIDLIVQYAKYHFDTYHILPSTVGLAEVSKQNDWVERKNLSFWHPMHTLKSIPESIRIGEIIKFQESDVTFSCIVVYNGIDDEAVADLLDAPDPHAPILIQRDWGERADEKVNRERRKRKRLEDQKDNIYFKQVIGFVIPVIRVDDDDQKVVRFGADRTKFGSSLDIADPLLPPQDHAYVIHYIDVSVLKMKTMWQSEKRQLHKLRFESEIAGNLTRRLLAYFEQNERKRMTVPLAEFSVQQLETAKTQQEEQQMMLSADQSTTVNKHKFSRQEQEQRRLILETLVF